MDTQPARQEQHARPPRAHSGDGEPSDAELLRRFVATRDEAAFALLVERYDALVRSVCRRLLHNYHDTEDACQATFLVLARKAQHIRQRDALASWLYKVAYRRAIKLRGVAQRQRQADQHAAPPRSHGMEDHTAWSDLFLALEEEFDRLPKKYRVPLRLCCLAGHTRQAAAQRLGWTLGALKMRLERGRRLLRARLVYRGLMLSLVLSALMMAC